MIDATRPSIDATSLRCVTAKSLISKADDAKTQMTQDSRPSFHGRPGTTAHGYDENRHPDRSRAQRGAVEGAFLFRSRQERSLDCAALRAAPLGMTEKHCKCDGLGSRTARDDAATARAGDGGAGMPTTGMRFPRRRTAATARRGLRPHRAFQMVSCGRANPLIPKDATASDRTDRKKRPSFYFSGRRAPLSASCGGLRGPPEAARGPLKKPQPSDSELAPSHECQKYCKIQS